MPLRVGLLVFGIALIVAALFLAVAGGPLSVQLGLGGTVLVLGVLFERRVYKPVLRTNPGRGWRRTDERFIDPASGGEVTVFIKPETGERLYVQESGAVTSRGRDPAP
jgi:membrane protein implicated in regulation of membrane protease activity